MVLKNLNGNDLVCAFLPTLDDLSKCASTEKLEHLVGAGERVHHLMLDERVIPFTVCTLITRVFVVVIVVSIVGLAIGGVISRDTRYPMCGITLALHSACFVIMTVPPISGFH